MMAIESTDPSVYQWPLDARLSSPHTTQVAVTHRLHTHTPSLSHTHRSSRRDPTDLYRQCVFLWA